MVTAVVKVVEVMVAVMVVTDMVGFPPQVRLLRPLLVDCLDSSLT